MNNEPIVTNSSWRPLASAALSIAVVVGLLGWQLTSTLSQNAVTQIEPNLLPTQEQNDGVEDLAAKLGYASPNATSSTAEQIAEIGTTTIGQLVSYYEYLNQNNAYTPDRGATIAASIAPTVDAKIPYGMHTIESIESTTDTSKNSVIAYRQALQTSLAPLKKNPGYELDIYNNYLQTKDELYMSQLKTMAANYHTAVNLTTKVTPPRDAVTIHVDILNSLTQFGTTLDFMIQNVDNPVTSLALLRAYERAEQDMFDAFSGINSYYLKKKIYE